MSVEYIYLLTETDQDYSAMGGKASAFAKLAQWALPVPQWVVLKENAFIDSLTVDQHKNWKTGSLNSDVFKTLKVNAAALAELMTALNGFDNTTRFAVRSSARSEDGGTSSFAGQFESVLNVTKETLEEAILAVWKSGFNERVQVYRQENQMTSSLEIPSVLVQQMVDSKSAGVAFGADPITGDLQTTVISAVYGLGSALVSGECDGDVYSVKNQLIVERHTAEKMRYLPGTAQETEWEAVKLELQQAPVLTDVQILEVSSLTKQVSRCFGRSMDIEWAFDTNGLYLLQARPITAMGFAEKPSGFLNIWDNSNIAESYGGVTSPLTFSFIRQAYEAAYRQMCLLLAVPKPRMAANDLVFSQMLGRIEGRVYYNLISWYKVLAMLPGYKFNRQFMEQMMGVKEGVPESVLAGSNEVSRGERIKDFFGLLGSAGSLIHNYKTLDKRTQSFYARLDDALAPKDLESLDLDGLTTYYRELEQKLLTRWDAPLINDFFAMIYYGLLRKLSEKWCQDQAGTLHNDLLCGMGDIISAEPAKRIKAMAASISENAEVVRCLSEGSLAAIRQMLRREEGLSAHIAAYIETFGDRCLDELKLESETLHEMPLPLYRSIGAFASLINTDRGMPERCEEEIRSGAEKQARDLLKGNPLKKRIFFAVAKSARKLVSNRENLRFERTRLFGRVRQIVLQMGYVLTSCGYLEEQKDVFYLEVHELLGFAEGTATTRDLKGLVSIRKREAKANEAVRLAERFETRGAVGLIRQYAPEKAPDIVAKDNALQGLGCCPGQIEGYVRVVRDPRGVQLNRGEILVAERTDPGWIMLFPAASGILVERGSLLSHAAIVAREMGIPAIVGLGGLTQWLKDGDYVSFDGSTGWVVKRDAENILNECLTNDKKDGVS